MFLRQSTASQEIMLGRFVDSSDGDTEETGLTINASDIKLFKGGATTLANKNSGGGTHVANGIYSAVLDATDTDTVGLLEVHVHVSGALAVRHSYYVLEEAVYDAFFAASAPGYVSNAPVNVAQFGGSNGTFSSGRPEVNLSHIAGSAVSTSTAQLGVNLVNIAGSAVSTSTAQLGVNVVNFGGSAGTFSSGRPEVNTTHWGGTAVGSAAVRSNVIQINGTSIAGTGSQVADSFVTMFNVSGGVFTVASINQTGDSYAIVNSGTHGNAAIKGYVDDIGTAGAGLTAVPWNAAWDAEVQSEVDDALIAKGLDHLVFASVAGTDVADDSIVAKLVSKSATADWDSFVNTTDALEALRDNVGTAGAGLTAVVWNAAWDAEVQSEVADALDAAIPGSPTANSINERIQTMDNAYTATRAGYLDNINNANLASVPAFPSNFAALGINASGHVSRVVLVDAVTAISTGGITSASFASGAIDATAIAADAIGSSELAASAITEIQSGLSTLTAAQVNAEVLDVLATDTYAEPGQGTPAATATLAAKINYIYKAWRNKKTQTSSQYSLYADDASTIDQKATVSDDGTTTTIGEVATGP